MKAVGYIFVWLWIAWTALGGGISPLNKSEVGQKAFDDLWKFYKSDHEVPIPGVDALEALKDPQSTSAQKKGASEYLLALLAQTLDDAIHDKTRKISMPWFDPNPPQALYFKILDHFCENAAGDDSLDIALWLIHRSPTPMPRDALEAMNVLSRTQTPRANAALKTILDPPSDRQEVLAFAINIAKERNLVEYAPTIQKLCLSPFTFVRETARPAAMALGVKEIPAFIPEKAIDEFDHDLRAIAGMILTPIPPGTPFVKLVDKNDPDEEQYIRAGWLLGESDGQYTLLATNIEEAQFDKSRYTKIDWSLEKEAEALIDKQNRKNLPLKDEIFSERVVDEIFSPQQALVAAWCYVRGKNKEAAGILFPCLDHVPDRSDFLEIANEQMANRYNACMLEAFAELRDYPEAIRIAEHICSDRFKDNSCRENARELAEQLKKRTDDFKTFVLPTIDEWKELQAKLTRIQQIQFLAAHMRLLSGYQSMMPDRVDFTERQSRFPRFDPKRNGDEDIELINPFVTLKNFNLTVAELPVLIEMLPDDNFVLALGGWAGHPTSPFLFRVSDLLAGIINDSVFRELIPHDLDELEPAGKSKALADAVAWCQANKDRQLADLIVETLSVSKSHNEFFLAAEELARRKDRRLLPTLISRLDEFPRDRHNIIYFVRTLDLPESVEPARKWVKEETDKYAILNAAIILLKHGDTEHLEGLAELKTRVFDEPSLYYLEMVFDLLIQINRPETLHLATQAVAVDDIWRNGDMVRALVLLGREEANQAALKGLDNMTPAGIAGFYDHGKLVEQEIVVADNVASEIASWANPKIDFDKVAPAEERAKAREEIKKWLVDQWALIKAGKPSNIKPYTPKE